MLLLEAQLTIKGYFFNTTTRSRASRLRVKNREIPEKHVRLTRRVIHSRVKESIPFSSGGDHREECPVRSESNPGINQGIFPFAGRPSAKFPVHSGEDDRS